MTSINHGECLLCRLYCVIFVAVDGFMVARAEAADRQLEIFVGGQRFDGVSSLDAHITRRRDRLSESGIRWQARVKNGCFLKRV